MVKHKYKETAKDINGNEVKYYIAGAKNKAGYTRIHESVSEFDLPAVLESLAAYAEGRELPACNMRF